MYCLLETPPIVYWADGRLTGRGTWAMARDSRDRQLKDEFHKAKEVTDLGMTATVRQGLPSAAARDTYRRLRDLAGKIRIPVDVAKLRADRR